MGIETMLPYRWAARPDGAFLSNAEVVADAVQVEPVSTPNFPANREINREFRRTRPPRRFFSVQLANECNGLQLNSLRNRTGNCFSGTENFGTGTGNFTNQNQDQCRTRFLVHTTFRRLPPYLVSKTKTPFQSTGGGLCWKVRMRDS
jgi:hypothetical protein